MSGSGPSVFGVYEDEQEAKAAAKYMKDTLKDRKIRAQIFVTEFYNE